MGNFKTPSIRIEIPIDVLEEVRVQDLRDAEALVVSLLKVYARGQNRAQRLREYEAYYDVRSQNELTEERSILAEFAHADNEAWEQISE